jgi:3-oxoacyl-[acyl-carrier protein] reductase
LDLELTGKIAIVGGSSKGIGLAAARSLARDGSKVTLVARPGDELQTASSKLQLEVGGNAVLAVVGDLSDPADIQSVFDATIARWGRVDIIVNNIGGPPPGELMDFTDDPAMLAFDHAGKHEAIHPHCA